MNEKELGKALLRGEDPIDLAALTDRVLRRDRRRIWSSGIACVCAWMIAVMLPWATILPMMAKVVEHQADLSRNSAPTAAEQREESMRVLQAVKQGTILTFLDSVGSMLLAAICTVSFITFSRRATLRQVNVRLSEISSQIKTIAGPPK